MNRPVPCRDLGEAEERPPASRPLARTSRTFVRTVLYVLAACVFLVARPASARPVDLTILHVNDTHAHLLPGGQKGVCRSGQIGGLARAAFVIEQTRQRNPNVLVLHAGDAFQGDPVFNTYLGVPELAAMGWLGFDAMAVGNHELDLGPDALLYSASTAFAWGAVPLLSANLDLSEYPALEPYVAPWILRDVSGLRVGIFGMTTPGDPLSQAAPVVIREDLVPVARAAVKDLHAAGARVVIALSHLGSAADEDLAYSVPGIDIIVGGHSHAILREPVTVQNARGGRTLIVQAGRFYEYIGRLRVRVNHGTVSLLDYRLIDLDENAPEDPVIVSVLGLVKQGVNKRLGDLYCKPVGIAYAAFSDQTDSRQQARDTPIGNLVTDAFRARGMTHIAITPNGLLSQGLPPGWLTGSDVFRVVSYGFDPATGLGFNLATFRISGTELVQGLEAVLAAGGDYQPQVSGLRFSYDGTRPEGKRIDLSTLTIDGASIELDREYSVTANMGVVALLPMLGVRIAGVVPLDVFEYEALRDYIFRRGIVAPVTDGRVRDVSGPTACVPGLLGQPWKCGRAEGSEDALGLFLPTPGAEALSGIVE